MSNKVLVLGAGGFIGSQLVRRLKNDGLWVRGADQKAPTFEKSTADEFIIGDLRDQQFSSAVLDQSFSGVYQLAADMGGAGYLFTGLNDADVMANSTQINLNILNLAREHKVEKIFYSSSACVYPQYNQMNPNDPNCIEDSVYPAEPDSEYGWEKLFAERLYLSFHRNYNLNVRIGRFHNIFGPGSEWQGGKEKAPAAIIRKVVEAPDGGIVEIWGDGQQTRSFLYIDDCLEGVTRLMDSSYAQPLNIGSDYLISLNNFALLVASVAGKKIAIRNVPGPEGVRGRNSDNALIEKVLGWRPNQPLISGVEKTFEWIASRISNESRPISNASKAPLPRDNR